jgi:hypothetical protein
MRKFSATLAVLATTGILLATPAFGNVQMNNDFVSGFESGIQLAHDSDIYEYGCPAAHLAGPLGNVQQMLAPLKLMGGFVQDKNLETVIQTVDVFVNSLSSLMAVFTNYDGDDFCSGLIFGQNGAHMLVNIAKTLINVKTITSGQQGSIVAKPNPPVPQP